MWMEGVGGQDVGPGGQEFGWRHDPEVTLGMMDNEDGFVVGGGNVPSFSEELDGGGGAGFSWDMESEVKVEQGGVRSGLEARSVLVEGFVPSLVGS